MEVKILLTSFLFLILSIIGIAVSDDDKKTDEISGWVFVISALVFVISGIFFIGSIVALIWK